MTTADLILAIGLAMLGFGLSFLFSGMETGLYTINRVRLALRASRLEATAVSLRNEIRHAGRTLVVLLIWNNAANYMCTYGLTLLLHYSGMKDWTLIIVQAIVVTPLLFVIGEVLPKDLFRTHTDRWSYALGSIITIARWITTVTLLLPFVQGLTIIVSRLFGGSAAGNVSARQRVNLLIQEGAGAGVLSPSQTTLAERALAVRDRRVADVMVPWKRVAHVRIDEDYESRLAALRADGHSRLPVTDASGRVLGVVSWLDVTLQRDASIEDLMRPPLTFPPDTSVLAALSKMRSDQRAMAFVAQPNGMPIGLITLKNLVEPLTGKLAAW